MSLVPLPTGTTHSLTEDGMEFLPAFVRDRLEYLADVFNWHPDDEEDDPYNFTYYEVRGRLSDGHYTVRSGQPVSSLISIWIASDDNCNRSLYIGGSGCWICPDSHYLFFDAIDPTLLPEKPDLNVWWCIQYEEGIKVIKILACQPEEEVTENFPDGV
jgi:hypothetical protein